MISELIKEKLRERGILIGETPSFPSKHIDWPNGYVICKPINIKGNGHNYCESYYEDSDGNDVLTCSPCLSFWYSNSLWNIELAAYAPGPGPSDFKESFSDEESAFHRIIKYYFDPADETYKLWHQGMDELEDRVSKW